VSDREKKLEELFQVAAQLGPDEREGFFRRHCAGDPKLRDELEALLAFDEEETKEFLRAPVLASGAPMTEVATEIVDSWGGGVSGELVPERIGRYRVIERIGEGGMGTVYLAEQERPVRRMVALKIVKPGLDIRKVQARFERERQTLALMDHPCIAQIYDGGATDTGRPYFVMEYAPGQPITQYADDRQLGLRERLQLFCQVCDAVHHAHQKGIIHRDIKPTNVIVTEGSGRPVPKVIDFGIARPVDQVAHAGRRQTKITEVLGTSMYMSPEQAFPGDRGVDIRTDVYSLGVLLFELLCGAQPYEPTRLRAAPADVQRMLQEEDAPAPSTRLTRLGKAEVEELAARRGLDGRELGRRLAGDLDWVVLKAIDRDRERRYASASGLAYDVRLHLRHEPVLAGPPGVGYRLSKLLRRHRVSVAAGAMVLVALVLGIIGLAYGFVTAEHKRSEAEVAAREAKAAERLAGLERQAANEARAVAEKESMLAGQIRDFLVNVIALADPAGESFAPDPTLYEVLRKAGQDVDASFVGSPEAELAIRCALGRAFHSVGRLEDAEEHLRLALDLQQGLLGTTREETYELMWELAQVYADGAERSAFLLTNRAAALGTRLIAERDEDLGSELHGLLRHSLNIDTTQAIASFERADELAGRSLGAEDPLWKIVADVYEATGFYLAYTWHDSDAQPLLERALSIRRQRGTEPTDIARSLRMIGLIECRQGAYARAEEIIAESLDIYAEFLPENHWLLSSTRSLQGEALSGLGFDEEAERLLLQSHEELLGIRGLTSRAGLESAWRLVQHHEERGRDARYFRAELREAFARCRNAPGRWERQPAAFGDRCGELVAALEGVDEYVTRERHVMREQRGRDATYEVMLETVLGLRRQLLEDDDPLAIIVTRALWEYSLDLPRDVDPVFLRQLYEDILRVLEPYTDELPDDVADVCHALASLAWGQNDLGRAETYYRRAAEIYRGTYGERPTFDTMAIEGTLRVLLRRQGRHDEIEQQLIETWNDCVAAYGPSHELSTLAASNLVELYDDGGQPERADSYLRAHLEGRIAPDRDAARLEWLARLTVQSPGRSPELYELAHRAARRATELEPELAAAHASLAAACYRLGRYEEALAIGERAQALREPGSARDFGFELLAHRALGDERSARGAWIQVQNHRCEFDSHRDGGYLPTEVVEWLRDARGYDRWPAPDFSSET